MKVKDIIKKQTTIIALAVIMVTIAVIGVSYAVFFDVKRNSEDQVITAGTLEVTLTNVKTLEPTEPLTTEAGLKSTGVDYTIANTGNLNASYSIYIYKNTGNTVDLSKIKYSLDGQTSATIASITDVLEDKYYKIDSGIAAANDPGETKNLKLWVDEGLVDSSIDGQTVDLELYIVSEVQE